MSMTSAARTNFSPSPGSKGAQQDDVIQVFSSMIRGFVFLSSCLLIYAAVKGREVFQTVESYRPGVYQSKTDARGEEITIVRKDDFQEYEDVLKTRDIFQKPLDPAAAVRQELEVPAGPPVNFADDYRLVGIVLGKNSQAVIEDLQKKETLFLSSGDKIGPAVVKEIYENKVIFMHGDQRIELIVE